MSPAAGASALTATNRSALKACINSVSFPSLRDYVFKRISLELLLCRVGEEELLICSFAPKPLKPVVSIGQLPLRIPRDALESSATNLNIGSISCTLRLLHVCGPHIFNSAPGGRRAQAIRRLFSLLLRGLGSNPFLRAGPQCRRKGRGVNCFAAAGDAAAAQTAAWL
jgi:hypothetical protein